MEFGFSTLTYCQRLSNFEIYERREWVSQEPVMLRRCIGGGITKLSTRLKMLIGHYRQLLKLTYRA